MEKPTWLSLTQGALGSRFRSVTGCPNRLADHFIVLVARVSVGAVFWRSGQTKLAGWHLSDNAVYLFQTEYKLPFIDAWTAAFLTAVSESVFSVLLIVGLASRVAGLVLLGITLVIELFVYPDAWPTHGTWSACLLLVIARGAGRFSLDHAMVKHLPHRRSGIGLDGIAKRSVDR